MTAFWIIGAIVSYIGIGLCVSAWNIRTSGDSEWCVVVALIWPLLLLACAVALVWFAVWFAIKWVVFRLAGENYSWKEFKEFIESIRTIKEMRRMK